MANAQRVTKGFIRPVYINETNNKQSVTKGSVYINQTIAAVVAASHKLLTTMGVG